MRFPGHNCSCGEISPSGCPTPAIVLPKKVPGVANSYPRRTASTIVQQHQHGYSSATGTHVQQQLHPQVQLQAKAAAAATATTYAYTCTQSYTCNGNTALLQGTSPATSQGTAAPTAPNSTTADRRGPIAGSIQARPNNASRSWGQGGRSASLA